MVDQRPPGVRAASAVLLVLGGSTFFVHLYHLVSEDEFAEVALGVVPPMVVSLALVGVGYWLARSDIEGYVKRILGWTAAGAVGLVALGAVVLLYQTAHGVSFADVEFVILSWAATGALGGSVIGIYDAQRQSTADALACERDRLAERERALARKNDQLEQFAGVLSHDLRNPLNVASAKVNHLLESADAETSDHLEDVNDAHDRMEDIIEEVLTMVRDGGSVTEDDMEPVHLNDVAESCCANVDTGNADLIVESDLEFMADRSRLHHVFENLFRNSVEHATPDDDPAGDGGTADGDRFEWDEGPAGSHPTVRVGPLADGDGFYVEDDGPGLPADADVFEPGYSTASNGTGLGLAIVETVVEGHGWIISATDGTDGGARFEISGVTPA